MQRIDVGDQVAANPISIYQLHHPRLTNRLLVHLIGAHEEGIAIDVPAQGRVRNAKIGEDLFVEFMFAQQQFMHAREERAGFRALNDAMVVSAADVYCFTDPKLWQNLRRHRLIFRRVFDRSRGDDYRLPGHQTRGRRDRADSSGISECDRRPLKIRDLQFAFACAPHRVVINCEKIREAKLVRILDVGHQ